MLSESIAKLVQYGITTGLTPECERNYTTNPLLDVFHEDDYEKPDNIEESVNLEAILGELLDEVEAIVYSGTKLNIDYFLEEIMDEDHLLDIYDYFKESTTDKIDDALDELGDEFTEEEVRLVRIKFISEMAN